MPKVLLVFVLLVFSSLTFSDSDSDSSESTTKKNNELSEFEVMLKNMGTCPGIKIYYDKKLQRSVHPYFIGKVPSYIDDEIVTYDVEEYFYGMKVIKITIPNNFPVVEIEIDEDIESVKSKVKKIFFNGFYSTYPDVEDLDKPVVVESNRGKGRTSIICD